MTHYEVLAVPVDASAAELKAAYRQLAWRLHPDRNQGDLKKAERFKALTEAYGVLSDPEKRAKYDRLRNTPPIILPGARDFVVKAGADVIDHAAGEATKYAAERLSTYGKLGKKAAKAAEILLEVGKEWSQGKLASFAKKHA